MINKNKIIKALTSGLLILGMALVVSQPIKADTVEDAANGVRYDNDIYCTVGYAYRYAYGGGSYSYVSMDNRGDRVMNVKSSSPNLIAKKASEYYYISKQTHTEEVYDENYNVTGTKQVVTDNSHYGSTDIAVFAKKAGTYTVTFDVVKSDGTVRCKKSIKVRTKARKYVSPIQSCKYAGKEIGDYYPYTTKTAGKLSVKPAKGYKIAKIEIGTTGANGEVVYKAVKNNKTIKLAKKTAYVRDSDYSRSEYDALFPETEIKITVVNKKSKEEDTYYYDLATINKK